MIPHRKIRGRRGPVQPGAGHRPECLLAQLLSGRLCLSPGRLCRGFECGLRLRGLVAGKPNVSTTAAWRTQALKQSQPALADYQRAIDLDPSLGAAACAASGLLAQDGRYDEAAATLRSA